MPNFPRIVETLQVSMKAANMRHLVYSNNIANVNVPEYQGFEVQFEEQLKAALGLSTDPQHQSLTGLTADRGHIPIPQPQRLEPMTGPRVVPVVQQMRQDGNNIDIEDQMAKLAANQLWYQALVRSVSDEFERLRSAIHEGRR